MYNGIKYFSCLLYTNGLLHFCPCATDTVHRRSRCVHQRRSSRASSRLCSRVPAALAPTAEVEAPSFSAPAAAAPSASRTRHWSRTPAGRARGSQASAARRPGRLLRAAHGLQSARTAAARRPSPLHTTALTSEKNPFPPRAAAAILSWLLGYRDPSVVALPKRCGECARPLRAPGWVLSLATGWGCKAFSLDGVSAAVLQSVHTTAPLRSILGRPGVPSAFSSAFHGSLLYPAHSLGCLQAMP